MLRVYYKDKRTWKQETIDCEPKDYERICEYLQQTQKSYQFCTKITKNFTQKKQKKIR